MKIIQSFWSGQNTNIEDNRGWLSYEYHWLGWILSCNQLVKFYTDVELYTDNFGYEILIQKLKLPYTKVNVVLNEINKYPKDLWALAKIKTYELQKEPFLHVDGDVFIWDKFPKDFLQADLIAQNLENTTDYYREMWDKIVPHLKFIPEEINNYHTGKTNLGCNMGIIGGRDIAFFQKYTQKSFEFVDKNKDAWADFNLFNFNIFFEQQLFYEMSCNDQIVTNYLFEEVWGDNSYLGFGNFQDIPHKRFYLHLLGDFKRRQSICKNLEAYVLKEYPNYFKNLKEILPKKYNTLKDLIPNYNYTKASSDSIVSNLKGELKLNKLQITPEILFARDLLIPSLHAELDSKLENNTDFLIFSLDCFNVEEAINDNINENQNLVVKQWDSSTIRYDFDEIDILMINELQAVQRKNEFISNMQKYIDDDLVEEDVKEFIILLENRLKYFLECKIILIADLV